jgi:23S rRNA (cytidine1920-2'-O)/16S rRNA (cytidine1409-2'-O)-methyltransferase
MPQKQRLDTLVCAKGLAESRQKAQQYIMAGEIYVNDVRVDKPGMSVNEDALIEHRGAVCPFVSRGGYKLEKAMQSFPIELKEKSCMDIGASTGGFTDCMLQNGANHVYCVDVGYGQLAWKLRNDPRVTNYERTNIRALTVEQVPELLDFISIDVSFISLTLVLPIAKKFLKPNGSIVALIKPQFEAGKGLVGKNGVVRDPKIHVSVIEKMLAFCRENGYAISGLSYSPVKGPKGNIEFLLYLAQEDAEVDAMTIVEQAHRELDGEKE